MAYISKNGNETAKIESVYKRVEIYFFPYACGSPYEEIHPIYAPIPIIPYTLYGIPYPLYSTPPPIYGVPVPGPDGQVPVRAEDVDLQLGVPDADTSGRRPAGLERPRELATGRRPLAARRRHGEARRRHDDRLGQNHRRDRDGTEHDVTARDRRSGSRPLQRDCKESSARDEERESQNGLDHATEYASSTQTSGVVTRRVISEIGPLGAYQVMRAVVGCGDAATPPARRSGPRWRIGGWAVGSRRMGRCDHTGTDCLNIRSIYNMANLYPFLSKSQIKTRIFENAEFALACAVIMTSRQTDYEHETKTTVNKNRRGWMSSHAVNGTKLTDKLQAEGRDALEPNEIAKLQDMVSHYSKQLASHFRAEAIEANPELKAIADVFSAG